jgi:hypothetical protein
MRGLAVISFALGAVGCAAPFPSPMTASDVARISSGDAMVAYLQGPGASPAVCDLRASGPHLTRFDVGVAAALVDGLADGRIAPDLWRACADRVLASAPPADAAALFDAAAHGYRELFRNHELETSPALQARLAAMQRQYIERPTGIDPDPRSVAPLFEELRQAYLAGQLGPVAAGFARELLAVVDLEHGRYGGGSVDVGRLDDLAARGDVALLRRFADRLPAEALRAEARRRVVRLEIAASPYPEVRADAGRVEARVLKDGFNRVSLAAQPATRASLDAAKITPGGVVVRQDVSKQWSTVLRFGAQTGLSVLPELSLRGALWIDVSGISRPITLCAPPRMLDPSPCVAPEDVTIDNPLAYLDHGGAFHFVDRINAQATLALARAGHAFALPISVGGRRVVSQQWPLAFPRPDSLILSRSTGDGPDLKVTIERIDASLFAFAVTGDGASHLAVLEMGDLPAFRIVSRGATGASGFDGTNGLDGSDGFDGSSASCPSSNGSDGSRGGDGSAGSDGGDGDNGGNGGNIEILVDCGKITCTARDLAVLRRVFASEGGPGGSGGKGGRGGRGGRGGAGGASTSCPDGNGSSGFLSGGTAGLSGSDGRNGWDGRDGSPGRPGPVRLTVASTARPPS